MSHFGSPVFLGSVDSAVRAAIVADGKEKDPTAKWKAVSGVVDTKFGSSRAQSYLKPLVRRGSVNLEGLDTLTSVEALTLAGTVNNSAEVVTAFQNVVRRPDVFIDQMASIIERYTAIANQLASNSRELPDSDTVFDSYNEISQAYMVANWLMGNASLGAYDSKMTLSRGLASLRVQLAQGIPTLCAFFRAVCRHLKTETSISLADVNLMAVDTSRFATSGMPNIIVDSLIGANPWSEINEISSKTRRYERLQAELSGYVRGLLDPPTLTFSEDVTLTQTGQFMIGFDQYQVNSVPAGTKDWLTPINLPLKSRISCPVVDIPGVGNTTALANHQLANMGSLLVTTTNGTQTLYPCSDPTHFGAARIFTDPRALLNEVNSAAPTNYRAIEDDYTMSLEVTATEPNYPDPLPVPLVFVVPVRSPAGNGVCTEWTVVGPATVLAPSCVPAVTASEVAAGCDNTFRWNFDGCLAHTESFFYGYMMVLSYHTTANRTYLSQVFHASRMCTIRQNPMVAKPSLMLSLTAAGYIPVSGVEPTYAYVAKTPDDALMVQSVNGVPTLMAYLQQLSATHPLGLELLTVFVMDYMHEVVQQPVNLRTLCRSLLGATHTRVSKYYDIIVASKGLIVRSPEFQRFIN